MMMTGAAGKPASGDRLARAVKFALDLEPEEVARVAAAFKKRVGRA